MTIKKTTKLTIIISAISAIILISYLLFVNNNIVNNSNDVKIANINLNNYDIVLNNKELVFTNYLGKYKINFPKEWILQFADNNYATFFDPVAAQQTEDTELYQGMKIDIEHKKIDGNKSIEQLISELTVNDKKNELNRRNLTINSMSAVEIIVKDSCSIITTYVKNSNSLYVINGVICNVNEINNYTEIYNNVVSSFSLINT